jgi:gamma-glutamyltranspeptidase
MVALLAAAFLTCSGFVCAGASTEAKQGIATTVHPLASEAAVQAMRKGGNAIDAAVAAGLTLGVVDGFNSGLGGGCFLVIRLANGSFVAIDGRETAPAAATREMFLRDGKADPQLSQLGALAAGVPGALAAYDYAVRRYGRLSLPQLLLPAAELAEKGFELDLNYAGRLATTAKELKQFEAARAVFLKSDGAPFAAGETLAQPDLARTYRAVAENGIGWFYYGPFAQAAEGWMKKHGGLLAASDFQAYRVRLREPIRTTYRGCEIVGFPPPSSGGTHVAQILNVLEHFSTADAEGNWVACTATINTTFGSKVVVPGTGVVLNNEMDDFALQPGVENFFGLVGGEANAVAPGKRPLSSMSPTIVLRGGRPVLAVGAAGGPTIISQTVLTLVYIIDFGMPLSEALARPRFHHQWRPDELRIEKKAGEAVLRALEQRGHKVKAVDSLGATQAVARDTKGGGLLGAHDPRVPGKAAGF